MNERLKDNVDLEEARHDAQSRSHFHNIPDSLNKKKFEMNGIKELNVHLK